jgi:hypothetical protein
VRKSADSLRAALGAAILEHDVPAVDIAKIAQARKQGRQVGFGGRRTEEQHAEARDFEGRLRLNREWRGEKAASHGADERSSIH